jgi:hypothetical protein
MNLPLGPAFLSVWTLPLINYVTALLLGWMGVTLLFAHFPRNHLSPAVTELA